MKVQKVPVTRLKMSSTDSAAVKCLNYCLFTMLLGIPTLSAILTL